MRNQTGIVLGVIGVLVVLFGGIVYIRFQNNDAAAPALPNRPTPVPVQHTTEPGNTQPTIVEDTGNELPREAFNPPPIPPAPVTPGPGAPDPAKLIPTVINYPSGLMTPNEYQAQREKSWPVPSPLDDGRFQMQPSQLRTASDAKAPY